MKKYEPGEWISIEGVDAVVSDSKVVDGLPLIEYVFMCGGVPTYKHATWENDKWCPANDFGGYAENIRRLAAYVSILKAGRRNLHL